jgi:hypothetical protein
MNQENTNEANPQAVPQEQAPVSSQASEPAPVQAPESAAAPEPSLEQSNDPKQDNLSVKKTIILSLALHYGPALFLAAFFTINSFIPDFLTDFVNLITGIVMTTAGSAWFASWIIAIVCAVKNKGNHAAKVLLAVYSIEFIGIILLFIYLIKGILDILSSCSHMGILF